MKNEKNIVIVSDTCEDLCYTNQYLEMLVFILKTKIEITSLVSKIKIDMLLNSH